MINHFEFFLETCYDFCIDICDYHGD